MCQCDAHVDAVHPAEECLLQHVPQGAERVDILAVVGEKPWLAVDGGGCQPCRLQTMSSARTRMSGTRGRQRGRKSRICCRSVSAAGSMEKLRVVLRRQMSSDSSISVRTPVVCLTAEYRIPPPIASAEEKERNGRFMVISSGDSGLHDRKYRRSRRGRAWKFWSKDPRNP